MSNKSDIALGHLVQVLRELAPLELAEEWDNVGLLVEPALQLRTKRVLLTIDFTEEVLEEALTLGAGCIVAYHPVIFGGLKRLTQTDSKTRALIKAIQENIAIFSPHTALDSVKDGVNDWLCQGLGKGTVTPIEPSPQNNQEGQGRLLTLEEPTNLTTLSQRLKSFLSIPYLRVSESPKGKEAIRTIGVCAGAGASVLQHQRVDAYVTGEMRHHDILAARGSGIHVLLSEHTHTERGYLPLFGERIKDALPTLEVFISEKDTDPLCLG